MRVKRYSGLHSSVPFPLTPRTGEGGAWAIFLQHVHWGQVTLSSCGYRAMFYPTVYNWPNIHIAI